jgi:hypothetical protein
MKPFLLAFLVLILNTLGAPTEPVDDAARLERSKTLLVERLNHKKYTADTAVLEALEYFSSRREQVDSTLWVRCALFYNLAAWPESARRQVDISSDRDELWDKYPFFRIAEGDHTLRFGAAYSDRAVLMVQVFHESIDPFVKVQFASFFSVWFSRNDVYLDRKLSENVKTGRFTQEALAEFLATSALVRDHAINLDPHRYGELDPDFLRKISEKPIQIPWLQQYLRDNPLPAPITSPPQALPPEAPTKAEAVPAERWSTAGWCWLGIVIAILVGTFAWLRRVKSEERHR